MLSCHWTACHGVGCLILRPQAAGRPHSFQSLTDCPNALRRQFIAATPLRQFCQQTILWLQCCRAKWYLRRVRPQYLEKVDQCKGRHGTLASFMWPNTTYLSTVRAIRLAVDYHLVISNCLLDGVGLQGTNASTTVIKRPDSQSKLARASRCARPRSGGCTPAP